MPTSYPYLNENGDGIALLNYNTTYGTGIAQNEIAFNWTTSDYNAVTVANLIFNSWVLRMKTYLGDEAYFRNCEVTLFGDGGLVQGTSTNSAPVIGTSGGANCSPALALLVKKNTGLIGKENRGRLYFPSLGVLYVNPPDQISTGNQTAINTSLQSFMNDMVITNSIQPMLIRKTENITLFHRATVNSMTCETLLATQRRRQRKAAHR